jgi:hypothetical protein
MKFGKDKDGKGSPENARLSSQQPNSKSQHPTGQKPEWADGLRQLYDSVVEEPLPDSFKDLLAQLDDKS